jgi:solute:Na+ symporter, SSS family
LKNHKLSPPDSSIKIGVFFLLLLLNSWILVAGNYPKELKAYRGATPILDGKISPGEYDDATQFSGTTDWFQEFSANSCPEDLSLKAWVKHDGKNLFFAFDVTDDVIYGIDIPRWLPDVAPLAHDFTVKNSLPWFGDGIEIFLNPENKWDDRLEENTKGNGLSWQMVCSTHKSYKNGLKEGGLIEGELRNEYSWANYREWMKTGGMKASVHIKTGSEGHGYIIEWMIANKPCLEVSPGKYWSPDKGVVRMGLNIEVQDLDEKERGKGNFANMHHVDVWAEDPLKRGKSALKNLGTLIIYPGTKPSGYK